MKARIGWMVLFVLAAGVIRAQDVPAQDPVQTPAQLAAQAAAAKVLAIPDNAAAADALVEAVRAMQADPQAVADGVAELTIAALVKSDFQRVLQIMPLFFAKITTFVPKGSFQRLVASALLAAGDLAPAMTTAIMTGLADNPVFLAAVVDVAQDTAAPLPPALRAAVLAIPAVVLPPVVIIPGPYDGQ